MNGWDACERCRDDLKAFLDGELNRSRRREVESHLHECASCRGEESAMREIGDELRSLETDALDPALRARILASIPAPSPAPRRLTLLDMLHGRGIALAGAAALILLVAVVALPFMNKASYAPASLRTVGAPKMAGSSQMQQKLEAEGGPRMIASAASPVAQVPPSAAGSVNRNVPFDLEGLGDKESERARPAHADSPVESHMKSSTMDDRKAAVANAHPESELLKAHAPAVTLLPQQPSLARKEIASAKTPSSSGRGMGAFGDRDLRMGRSLADGFGGVGGRSAGGAGQPSGATAAAQDKGLGLARGTASGLANAPAGNAVLGKSQAESSNAQTVYMLTVADTDTGKAALEQLVRQSDGTLAAAPAGERDSLALSYQVTVPVTKANDFVAKLHDVGDVTQPNTQNYGAAFRYTLPQLAEPPGRQFNESLKDQVRARTAAPPAQAGATASKASPQNMRRVAQGVQKEKRAAGEKRLDSRDSSKVKQAPTVTLLVQLLRKVAPSGTLGATVSPAKPKP